MYYEAVFSTYYYIEELQIFHRNGKIVQYKILQLIFALSLSLPLISSIYQSSHTLANFAILKTSI